MKTNLFKSALFGSALALTLLASCKKEKGEEVLGESGSDVWPRAWISLSASFPDDAGTAGNGGTRVYALSHAEAIDPAKTINIYADGMTVRSERTARVQASENGNYLYNIQYTGTDGGIFNKYRVLGGNKFEDTKEEVNTAPLLGTSPRWTKAAEGIGIGVNLTGVTTVYEGTAPNFVYKYTRGLVKVAHIDLNDPRVPNSTEFAFPFSAALEAQGYSVGRVDVPVLNQSKTKIYIGCNVSKVNPAATPTISATGVPSWPNHAAGRTLGTTTLVLDYPSLQNPKLITSTRSIVNNHAYRTQTQYVGTDGHVYQATATSGQDILRIDKTTNDYDNTYHFSLDAALGITGARIQAFRYIKDNKAVVLYNIAGAGGYVALIDLTAKTATKIANDYEATLNFGQYQNIAVAGDNVYIPLTPEGGEGRLYVINWKTNAVVKGARLLGQTGSSYIGSY